MQTEPLIQLPHPEIPAAVLAKFATRADWLAARQDFGIGSSDVPAIMGLSRFQSPLALYHRKLGLQSDSAAYAEHAEWGHILEEPIAKRYAMKTGREVIDPNGDGNWTIARNIERPWMIASVDRFVRHGGTPLPPAAGLGVVEIKNAHLFMADEWSVDNNNEPPVEYQVQAQHQLAVTGLQWCSIAALIGGVKFVWADIVRDEPLIEKLIEIESAFMKRLHDRNPPEADGSESTRELLKKLYPHDTGEVTELPIDALEWHNELVEYKKIAKTAGEKAAEMENKLRAAIGDATMGVIPGGVAYTNKLQRREGYEVKPTEFRVLRLKGGKK